MDIGSTILLIYSFAFLSPSLSYRLANSIIILYYYFLDVEIKYKNILTNSFEACS